MKGSKKLDIRLGINVEEVFDSLEEDIDAIAFADADEPSYIKVFVKAREDLVPEIEKAIEKVSKITNLNEFNHTDADIDSPFFHKITIAGSTYTFPDPLVFYFKKKTPVLTKKVNNTNYKLYLVKIPLVYVIMFKQSINNYFIHNINIEDIDLDSIFSESPLINFNNIEIANRVKFHITKDEFINEFKNTWVESRYDEVISIDTNCYEEKPVMKTSLDTVQIYYKTLADIVDLYNSITQVLEESDEQAEIVIYKVFGDIEFTEEGWACHSTEPLYFVYEHFTKEDFIDPILMPETLSALISFNKYHIIAYLNKADSQPIIKTVSYEIRFEEIE